MFHWRRKREPGKEAADYATRKDFQKIFTEEMSGLHLLAFLLTADQKKAEQCFVAGLEESIGGNAIFKQWAHSWSRRSIIKNAMKMIFPAPGWRNAVEPASLRPAPANKDGCTPEANPSLGVNAGDQRSRGLHEGELHADAFISAITSLEPFTRFVLVMAVLEGYSVRECAALLDRTAQEVTAARSQALEQLSWLTSAQPADSGSRAVPWTQFLATKWLA